MVKASKRYRNDKSDLKENRVLQPLESHENTNMEQIRHNVNETNIHEKLNLVLDKLQCISKATEYLIDEIRELKTEIQDIKYSLPSTIDANRITNDTRGIIRESESLDNKQKGPFPEFKLIDRTLSRPSTKDIAETTGGKAHSLQFTCNLYMELIEKILGPATETGLDYRAMVKEAVLITKSVISQIKEAYYIDSNLRWSQVDPTIRLEAYQKLEVATEHLLPLKVCSEFWGAHVLLSNFWLKRKKPRNNNSSQSDDIHNNSKRRKKSFVNTSTQQNTLQNMDQEKKSPAFSISFLTD
ncbi:uncharacterized protein BX663DRAFT_556040 [Cokeromyces recurvatus]|uniref:uncharacterized protein n=1 Tax=Cokeromyces recurvatus TaxID=90255 RepID=UPI0022212AC6|nr:uncharacterized protein BX663DRAFT_556040 [Cokeromyces recurvatus]KAI7898234.1 hypothetical protein BX663DRAFT_556040 [Cokeromyces recurvatus]